MYQGLRSAGRADLSVTAAAFIPIRYVSLIQSFFGKRRINFPNAHILLHPHQPWVSAMTFPHGEFINRSE